MQLVIKLSSKRDICTKMFDDFIAICLLWLDNKLFSPKVVIRIFVCVVMQLMFLNLDMLRLFPRYLCFARELHTKCVQESFQGNVYMFSWLLSHTVSYTMKAASKKCTITVYFLNLQTTNTLICCVSPL